MRMQLIRAAPAAGPGRPRGRRLATLSFGPYLRGLGRVELLLGGGQAVPDQDFDGVGR